MRKFIIVSASIAALAVAALAIAAPSMAASTDANGVVTVTKGEVQSAMGWNNAQFEAYAPDVTFSGASVIKTTRYNLATCSNGEDTYTHDGHTYDRYVSDYFAGGGAVGPTAVKNPQGKITSWTLTASAGTPDWTKQVQSPTTGEWHDYVVDAENTVGVGSVPSPAGQPVANGGWCPDTVAYGPDVLLPNTGTLTSLQATWNGKTVNVPVSPYAPTV